MTLGRDVSKHREILLCLHNPVRGKKKNLETFTCNSCLAASFYLDMGAQPRVTPTVFQTLSGLKQALS